MVVTSYGTLSSDARAYRKNPASSILCNVKWFRIVLDEAHAVRNRTTEQAKASFQLEGERRWCMTGTPIQNKLDDVFPLLHFLKEDPWADYSWWRRMISEPFEQQDDRGLARLKAVMNPLLLRRTKSMLDTDGRPILELPTRHEHVILLDLSDIERDFYDSLHSRSKTRFDGFIAQGLALTKYVQILTLLLRLRQACDHPYLVLGRQRDSEEFKAEVKRFFSRFLARSNSSDLVEDKAPGQVNRAPAVSKDYIESLTNTLVARVAKQVDAPVLGLGTSDKDDEDDSLQCPICLDVPEHPVVSECGHIFCRACILSSLQKSRHSKCPICRMVLSDTKLANLPSAAPIVKVDFEKEWKHSSKSARLMEELEAVGLFFAILSHLLIFSLLVATTRTSSQIPYLLAVDFHA